MLLKLAPNAIDVWLVYFDEISAPNILKHYRDLLTLEECTREKRFHFPYDRHRYLVTRASVRWILSRYVGVKPPTWRFDENAFGRPRIADLPVGALHIDFNVSHTSGLIIVGVTTGKFLGVDVENVRLGASLLDVADQFFAPEEVRALMALPYNQQHERFFEYWTLKEAYIKARGLGLSIPLDLFSFHFPKPRRVAMSVRDELRDAPERWKFWQLRPGTDHLIAVCSEHACNGNFALTVRKTVPFATESVVDCPLSKQSP